MTEFEEFVKEKSEKHWPNRTILSIIKDLKEEIKEFEREMTMKPELYRLADEATDIFLMAMDLLLFLGHSPERMARAKLLIVELRVTMKRDWEVEEHIIKEAMNEWRA